jgi:pectin methylesterase-like acyl-CoA thioesterase
MKMKTKSFACLLALGMALPAWATTRSVPSQYSTIQAAVNAAASGDTISIANGTYNEQVTVASTKTHLTLIGASQTGVILQAGTNATALTIHGTDITVEYMTMKNTLLVGSTTSHAVYSDSARVEFYRCYIIGYQDTMYLAGSPAYFTLSEIRGCVDFIYGGAAAFFTSCNIMQVRPTGGPATAPNTPQAQTYGYVFSGCYVGGESGVAAGSSTLMRPWGAYGESVYINCTMDASISAAGWLAWDGREATCRAYEYGSKTPAGPTINLSTRAVWVVRLSATQAATYTKSNVLGGWNPPL